MASSRNCLLFFSAESSCIKSPRPPALQFFSLLLHTYLLCDAVAQVLRVGSTRPPLHIGASRTVYLPSGMYQGEFLMASTTFRRLFIEILASRLDLKKTSMHTISQEVASPRWRKVITLKYWLHEHSVLRSTVNQYCKSCLTDSHGLMQLMDALTLKDWSTGASP